MTSNLGVKKMQDFGGGIGFGTSKNVYTNQELKKTMLNKELKNYFAPEFINRLDEMIVFNSLKTEDVEKIVSIELMKLQNRLNDLKYNINFDKSCIDYITKIGFDDVYGARPLKRAIQDKFEDFISDEVLKGSINEGFSYDVSIDGEEVSIKEKKEKKGRKKKGE
jgi:ATP-dependent Clp protease ATP-binding subunit ClpC